MRGRYVDIRPLVEELDELIRDPNSDLNDIAKNAFIGFQDILMNLERVDVVPESCRVFMDGKWLCGLCGQEIKFHQNYCSACGGRLKRASSIIFGKEKSNDPVREN